MRWLVKEAQAITDAVRAIDSSDTHCLQAGLEAYDASKNRPALNSVNLEKGRGEELIELAKEKNAYVFANASGRSGMPADAAERVANLSELMDIMDRYDIAVGDRFLDPLVFPIGAAPDSANHYLGAVKALREKYPGVHIFGGHSNASFGMPGRKVINNAFIILAILAGCDALMIDPIFTPPRGFVEFRLAADVITAKDEFAAGYVTYWREKTGSKIQ